VRPGLMRFEYDGGDALVISDGINIGLFDSKSNARAQKYLLNQTPLRLLLQQNIDLTQPGISRTTSNDGRYTSVVLVDPKRPRDGDMTLVFSNKPPALTQWTVREKTGEKTTVILDSLEKVSGLNRRLFNIEWTELQRK
jgi:outer membrane lipoprotein-sorting protein